MKIGHWMNVGNLEIWGSGSMYEPKKEGYVTRVIHWTNPRKCNRRTISQSSTMQELGQVG
jgi:hypothetical protein